MPGDERFAGRSAEWIARRAAELADENEELHERERELTRKLTIYRNAVFKVANDVFRVPGSRVLDEAIGKAGERGLWEEDKTMGREARAQRDQLIKDIEALHARFGANVPMAQKTIQDIIGEALRKAKGEDQG